MRGRSGVIKILIADEQSLLREALRVALEKESDLEVVAEARDGVQAVAEAERTNPDVAVLGANLPNCDGVKAAMLIKERIPHCRILLLDGQEDQRALVAALEAGASGYLTKEFPMSDLILAARAISRGEVLVPPRMLEPLLSNLIKHRKEHDEAFKRMSRLTRREREVLSLLADGADNARIAQALVISPQTARTHVQNVLSKLDVHSRLEAAMFWTQNDFHHELVVDG
jgi:two-component system NarL family response regulator